MDASKLKRWLVVGIIVAVLGVVINAALILADITVTITMGAADTTPPYVPTGFPIDIDVTYHVEADPMGRRWFHYRGDAEFCFRNQTGSPMLLEFPLVRAAIWDSSGSTRFLFHDQLPEPFRTPHTIELKPGEEHLVRIPVAGLMTNASKREVRRWGLVFTAPTDSSGDQYAAGTIVTHPVRWETTQSR